MLANVCAPMLPSQMAVLNFVHCFSDMPTPFPMAFRISRRGTTNFIAVLNALFLASIVEVAMSGWGLLVHRIGQLVMQMAKPG